MRGSTRSASPPLIGITSYLEAASYRSWIREAALLPAGYARAVERAGAIPVLLPPTDLAAEPIRLEALVWRLDGLVIAGGSDVDPELYGAEPHDKTDAPQPHRDRFEFAMLRAAIDADLPFLAICRGMQVLNVLRGGSLVQHLPDVVGSDIHSPAEGRFGTHRVQISVTSRLGKLLGDHAEVPTSHHQAVKRLGKGLVAVAWADDQVIEAVEVQGHRFGVGVQWHPEEGADLTLFEALVAESRSPAIA